jgi:hypothetical protein
MSALARHLQTCPARDGMTASPLEADIRASDRHVRLVPTSRYQFDFDGEDSRTL